ncbi:MAG TPA: hypothetical protein VE959_00240 [Bryobacteraceae bacterium]|nr:hypothetical protein [Bryobacteraceae bacterium]
MAASLFAVLVFAVYSNSFQDGFVLDSRGRILNDPRVLALNRHNLTLIFTENYWWPRGYSNLYRPVTTLSYLLNRIILPDPDDAAGYRLVNLFLHAGNAFLLYLLALWLMGRPWPAVLTASLWAVHPAATESVTNIVGRADELSAMAVLGALLIHIHLGQMEANDPNVRRPASPLRLWLWRAALMLITLAGLLAKEVAAVIPALALLFDVTFRRRSAPRGGFWARYAVFGPPLLLAGYLRAVTFAHSGPMEDPFVDNPIRGAGFLEGRLTAVKVIGKYLWLLVWPARQSCDYSYNQIPLVDWRMSRPEDWKALAALAAIVLLALAAIALYRFQKAGFFFLGFFALTLLPVSNLAFPIGTIMAERLLYLPAAGFAGCLVLAACAGAKRLGLGSRTAAAVLVLIVLAWGARTWRRNLDWTDDVTLWTTAATNAPDSFKGHLGLAEAWLYEDPPRHSIDDAIAETETAMAIVAGLPAARGPNNVYAQLGELYRQKGESLDQKGAGGVHVVTEASRTWYDRAAEVLSRGVVVDRAVAAGMRQQELARGKRPGQIAPFGLDRLYASLGLTNLRLGRPQQALAAFLEERRLDPGNPAIYRNISSAQLASGRLEEAAVALMGAQFVSNSDLDTFDIRNLYDRMDGSGCAVARRILPVLDTGCPLVHRDICAALLDVTAALLEGKADRWARQTRDLAVDRYACTTQPFDKSR